MIKIPVGAVALLAAVSLGFGAQAQTPWTYDAKAAAAAAAKRNILQEERNRALVLYFSEQVFNQHNLAVAEAMLAPDYRQHNPKVPDGREAFIAYFKKVVFAGDPGVHSDVVRSATDGDLVYVHVRQYNGAGKPVMAILNIFRVKDDKIAEHWDLLQAIPDTAANNNTMF